MRFLRLDLLAYGPFTGRTIDLSGGADGLHVIYGPNEAGKTSARGAISDLLFGFDHQTAADFVHPMAQLRVGALLRRASGETLEIVRRKGRSGTLLNPSTNKSWPDDVLAPCVGGLTRKEFEQQFSLTHATLRDQDKAPRAGVGLFGETLFAAAAGLPNLRRSEQDLKKRLDVLFVPKGRNQKIAISLQEIEVGQSELASLQLSADMWSRERQQVEEAERASSLAEERRQEARAAHDRLDRRSRALPLCLERRQLVEALKPHAATPRLEPEAGKQRVEAQARERQALEAIREARAQMPSLLAERAELPDVSALLELAPEIERLNVELGAYRKAREDRVKRLTQCQSDEHEAREILRDLRRDPDELEADRHRVSEADAETLMQLAEARGALQLAADEARAGIREQAEAHRQARQGLARLARPADTTQLRELLEQARALGDLEKQLQVLDTKRALADRALKASFQSLPAFSGTVEELEAQVVPVEETVARLAQSWNRVQDELRGTDAQARSIQTSLRQVMAELEALDAAGEVPSPQALASARTTRDRRFEQLVEAFERGGGEAERRDYQASVKAADELADRLWHEADRVARRLQKGCERDRLRAEEAAHTLHREEVVREREELEREWQELRGRLRIALESPVELGGWLRVRADVLEKAERRRLVEAEIQGLAGACERHRSAILEECARLGQPLIEPGDTLAAVVLQADRVVAEAEGLRRRRLQVKERAAQARELHANARRRSQEASLALSRWKQAWSQAVGSVGLGPEATTDQVRHTLARLQELQSKLKTIRDFQRRIAGIDHDAREFEADVHRLAERAGVESRRVVDVVVADLNTRLTAARTQRQKLETLEETVRSEERRLAVAQAKLEGAARDLTQLCRTAGCDDPADLPEIERRAAERDQLEARLASCEEALRTHASGLDVEAFATEVEALDPQQLESDLASARQRLEQVDEEVKAAHGRAVTARNTWESHSGGDAAARASERIQLAQARLAEEVAEFTRLKLAQAVLRQAIDRYRERSQGPIMDVANRYFGLLTCGSFVGLELREEDGEVSLEGRRLNASTLGFKAMSDGTRDQLYLALRLAALQQWLESHEPVPLVVDDILLTFDDQRAAAALEALAELSRFTQVLLFTHHEHLVDLAERTLSPAVLFLQRLPATMGQAVG